MGLFDTVVGNEVKKFVKRKDSDAGEAGRALEELRGSLYNDLRTSEGAKRQQQRLCGPVVAMTFNFMVSVGIILANKLVMGRVGFKFPIFLTLIHYVTAWLLLAIFKSLSILPVAPPSRTTPFTSLFSLGAVMAFASGLANTSLKHNSVGFYQMAKIAVTPTIVFAEFILFRKTISSNKVICLVPKNLGCTETSMGLRIAFRIPIPVRYARIRLDTVSRFWIRFGYACGLLGYDLDTVWIRFGYGLDIVHIPLNLVLALGVVSAGVAVATVTDLEFNLFGAVIAIAWIVPSAINKILWSSLQQQANWTALALMWKTTPVTIFFLLALMPWLDPPGVLLFHWNINNTSAILISAVLGFLLQWSGALTLGATSATSHVVLGQFKTCVILLGGYLIFSSDPGFLSICGAVAALCGMSVYTTLNLNLQKLQDSAAATKQQILPTLKPKATDEKSVSVVDSQVDVDDNDNTSTAV